MGGLTRNVGPQVFDRVGDSDRHVKLVRQASWERAYINRGVGYGKCRSASRRGERTPQGGVMNVAAIFLFSGFQNTVLTFVI